MLFRENFREKIKPTILHFAFSALIAILASFLVLFFWYPAPYDSLAGGWTLLSYLVLIDFVCGPFLTFILYDKKKSYQALVLDIGIVIFIQFSALGYGIYSLAQARPVFLAYEGVRYRLVSPSEIDMASLPLAHSDFQSLPISGPQLVGVRLSQATDPDFPASVQLSLAGLHSAFRPQRWVPYSSQLDNVKYNLQPLGKLEIKYPDKKVIIEKSLKKYGVTSDQFGYLPLDTGNKNSSDWVVLVDRKSGLPRDFLPIDGW